MKITWNVDECETKYIAHTAGPMQVLSVNKDYQELTDAERSIHHNLNDILGSCEIADPPVVGEYYGIVLKDHWVGRFQIGQTYTPREIVDEMEQLFTEVKEAFEGVLEMARLMNNSDDSEECAVALISPEGDLWESPDGYYHQVENHPFYVNVDGGDLPDVDSVDMTGWEIVCSIDGDVIFSGVVDSWSADEFESDDETQMVVEFDCVPDEEQEGD